MGIDKSIPWLKELENMIGYKARKIWRMEIYQGADKKKNYFEGWYFKVVDAQEKSVYAIIPGISMGKDETKSHAFIQIINGKTNESNYFTYNIGDFAYSKDKFEIRIKNNYFSLDKIKLDINFDGQFINGELGFKDLLPWPNSLFSPGTMGWYTFVPFMECYHGCISFGHIIEGSINVNEQLINFDGGNGYMEKDWGNSFPSSWIWAQCNHFGSSKASIMVSVANIPWLGSHFRGFIVGMWYEDKFYKFATYTGARLSKIMFKDNRVFLKVYDNKYELNIELSRSGESKLYSPINGVMTGKVNESISAKIKVSLWRMNKRNNKKIFECIGRNVGLELMGNLKEIEGK